jgi:hypothetical protein
VELLKGRLNVQGYREVLVVFVGGFVSIGGSSEEVCDVGLAVGGDLRLGGLLVVLHVGYSDEGVFLG